MGNDPSKAAAEGAQNQQQTSNQAQSQPLQQQQEESKSNIQSASAPPVKQQTLTLSSSASQEKGQAKPNTVATPKAIMHAMTMSRQKLQTPNAQTNKQNQTATAAASSVKTFAFTDEAASTTPSDPKTEQKSNAEQKEEVQTITEEDIQHQAEQIAVEQMMSKNAQDVSELEQQIKQLEQQIKGLKTEKTVQQSENQKQKEDIEKQNEIKEQEIQQQKKHIDEVNAKLQQAQDQATKSAEEVAALKASQGALKVAPVISIQQSSPQEKVTEKKQLNFRPPRKGSEDSFSSAASFDSKTSSMEKEDDASRMDYLLSKVNGSQIQEGPVNTQKKNAPKIMLNSEVMEESKNSLQPSAPLSVKGGVKMSMLNAGRPTLAVKKKTGTTVYQKKLPSAASLMKEAQRMGPEVRQSGFLKRSMTKKKTRKILEDFQVDELEVALEDALPMDERILIIDFGTGMARCGYHDMPKPLLTFHNRVVSYETEYIEDPKYSERQQEEYAYPLIEGSIDDWQDVEKVWTHIFKRLKAESHQIKGVMISENSISNTNQNREQLATLLFENFDVQNLFLGDPASLSLYAAGKVSGLVFDSGEGVTRVAPVFEGFVVPYAIKKIDMAGLMVTNYLKETLREQGIHTFEDTSFNVNILRQIKEKYCFCAMDFKEEYMEATDSDELDVKYTLPDGKDIDIPHSVRIQTCEFMFCHDFNWKTYRSLPELTYQCLQECENDIRQELTNNFVFTGGNTQFKNFTDRFSQELEDLAPAGMDFNYDIQDDRENNVWVGGSVLASLSTFDDCWISKENYEEYGIDVVNQEEN